MHGGNAGIENHTNDGMEKVSVANLQEDGAEGEETTDGAVKGISGEQETRLDDFWSMTLNR